MVELDGGRSLGLLVADVCGHGITAAFITAMTKITFQTACHGSLDPAVVLRNMNQELAANLTGGFVTVFYGIYDLERRSFAYASGGHPPVLVLRRPERRVLQLRFGLEDGRARTLEEVGKEFNVTRERIRQIENNTLKKLEHLPEAQALREAALL